ncbi:MAG: class I SAM-dependent methyltransferase [Rhodoferax sp.]|nr:class I SAM-dependent methyltransferase [Rhodoferax sp.]
MNPPANFDRLARVYRWLEALTFGPLLMRSRCAFLHDMSTCRTALVLGDGDGRFTARLLAANPLVQIDAVDASPAMLRALQRNAGPNFARVRSYAADARTWQPLRADYALVTTHFFLDCLTTEEVSALATRLRSCIAPDARWIVSEFTLPPNQFGRLIARPLVAALYRAFGLLTGLAVRQLPNHRHALSAAGFALAREHRLLSGLLVSELWRLAPPGDPAAQAGKTLL